MNSLRSKVRPPSKSMIATAKEMKIGRKSPKAFGSKKLNPSGPSKNPPKSKSTKVGKCNFLESVVRKQPAPTAKQSVHKAELLLEIELNIRSNMGLDNWAISTCLWQDYLRPYRPQFLQVLQQHLSVGAHL